MAVRPRIAVLLGSIALLMAAFAWAGPAPAGANACHRFGDKKPLQLTHGQARRSIRCFLNKARKQRGLHRLERSSRLADAAQKHTDFMTSHDCFDHECPGEPSLVSRLTHVGFIDNLLTWLIGENIAWGGDRLGTPRSIFHAWMHSPEHKANILEPRFESVGVGFTRGKPGKRGANAGTYTTDFGMRKG